RTSASWCTAPGFARPFVTRRRRSRAAPSSSTTHPAPPRRPTASWRVRSSRRRRPRMARKRASMREGPLAELFRATEAAQRTQGDTAESPQPTDAAPGTEQTAAPPAQLPLDSEPTLISRPGAELDATVEHVYDFEVAGPEPAQPAVTAVPDPEPAEQV